MINLAFYEQRKRVEFALLLELALPVVLTQIRMHAKSTAARARWEHEEVLEAMQERLDERRRRCEFVVKRSRASIRRRQDMDGRDALPDQNQAPG